MSNINHTLYTALATPLLENGELDISSYKNLLGAQAQAGNGVVLLGSTGEGANLNRATREQVLEVATQAYPELDIIVGIGGIQLEETLSWLDYCETLPVSGYLMVTPVYAKPGTHGQIGWFKTLMDHVNKPCMLYNVPSRTSVEITTEAIRALINHPNFWAVKEASGNPERFSAWAQEFPSIQWYSGDDLLIFEHSKMGATGLVSVASNIWPQETANLVQLLMQGHTPPITIDIWKKASLSLFIASNPVPTKCFLAHNGSIQFNTMQLPLSPLDCPDIQAIIDSDLEIRKCIEVAA
ncbi:MAG: 4-hydroxy-tetrahydrodipicolinate synthase [bacterium]